MATTAPAFSTPKKVAANSIESKSPMSTRSSGRTPSETSVAADAVRERLQLAVADLPAIVDDRDLVAEALVEAAIEEVLGEVEALGEIDRLA